MSTLQFPANPAIGDTYDWDAYKYVWDGGEVEAYHCAQVLVRVPIDLRCGLVSRSLHCAK